MAFASVFRGIYRKAAIEAAQRAWSKADERGREYWRTHSLLLPALYWVVGAVFLAGFLAELQLLPRSWSGVKGFGSCLIMVWMVRLQFFCFYSYKYCLPSEVVRPAAKAER